MNIKQVLAFQRFLGPLSSLGSLYHCNKPLLALARTKALFSSTSSGDSSSKTFTTMNDNSNHKPEIAFVTGNKKKLEEVKQILAAENENELAFNVTNVSLDLPELQGDPLDIAREKCRLATEQVQGACFTEDTSLCFHALNGMPGPYIKWFLEKCGHDGLNQMLVGFEDKTAYAQTVVAFCAGTGQEIHVFDGRTEGTIVPPRGSMDFGWDPIFQPHESHGKTYAEMDKPAKNAISHRGRAMEKFRQFLIEQSPSLVKAIGSK